jgi:hypothetical protein
LWSNGATSASITVTAAGSYSVRVTNANGCQSASSAATVVTVNTFPATPTITPVGPIAFCAGGSATLTSSAGTSYLWSNGATTQSISATTSGNYTVQVTNAGGCQSAVSAATVVTVNALPATPTITPVGPLAFCAGGSVTLTSSAGTSYLWSNGATTPGITVNTTGSYSVRVTNASGCQSLASSPTTVTVNPILTAAVSISASANPVNTGTSVTFTASPVNGGTSPVYQWYKGATLVGGNSATYSYIPVNGDVIKVVMTSNATPCLSGSQVTSNSVTMTVNTVAASVSIFSSGNPVCSGTSVTFYATPVNGGSPTYQWHRNGSHVGTGSTYTYTPSNGDQVYVIMTSSLPGVTGSPATSNTITMTVNAVPGTPGNFTASTTFVNQNRSYVYTVPYVSGVTYTWSYSGRGATISGTSNSVTVSFSRTANSGTLSVRASNGCGTSSARSIYIYVNSRSSEVVPDSSLLTPVPMILSTKNEVSVYPNPTTGPVTFEFQISENSRATLDITSMNGEQIARIFDAKVEAGIKQKVVFEKSLPPGVYLYYLRSNNHLLTGKFIKIR